MDRSALGAAVRRITDAVNELLRRVGQLEAKAQKALALGYGPGAQGGSDGTLRGVVTNGGSIATGSSGTVTLYDDTGAATSRTVTAKLWLTGPVANGTKVYVEPVGSGYDIVQADCP